MMKCEIVRDLIPLCIDGCSSEESEALVTEHLEQCRECAEVYQAMQQNEPAEAVSLPSFEENPLRLWQATVLQSVLLFLSFAMLVFGVFLEWRIPSGFLNGSVAVGFVVPVTAFLLSLVNWNFIRFYKSKRQFQLISVLVFLILVLCADVFSAYHYGMNWSEIFADASAKDIFEFVLSPLNPFLINAAVSALMCAAVSFFSGRFGRMTGKS